MTLPDDVIRVIESEPSPSAGLRPERERRPSAKPSANAPAPAPVMSAAAVRRERPAGGGAVAGAGSSGVAERDPRLADVAQALLRVALQAAVQQAPDSRRGRGGQGAPVDVLPHHRGEDVRDRLALEQLAAGQHLEEDGAESPNVGAFVDGLPARLLRRHVGCGAEQEAGLGAAVGQRRRLRQRTATGSDPGRVARPRLGEAEVEHLHLAVRADLHVRGLEVAVDDPLLVGGLERLGDLLRDRHGLVERDAAAGDALREVLPLGQLEDEERLAALVLEAVEVGDRRVVERGQQLRLALEAGEPVGVGGEGRWQELDRHVAAELRVGRAVHLAHAPRAEGGDDRVRPETLAGGQAHARRGSLVCARCRAAAHSTASSPGELRPGWVER